jgi:hypothetical protein
MSWVRAPSAALIFSRPAHFKQINSLFAVLRRIDED